MAQVIVLTNDGREVARKQVDHHETSQAVGRELVGRNEEPLGWLGRALRDARIIQAGGDPEMPSEKAMHLAERRRDTA